MTKLRTPLSFEDGLDRAIDLLGRPVAETEVGAKPRTLRAWSDPDDERQLPIGAALKLDRACQARGFGTPIFDAYALQLEASGHAIGHSPVELARRLCRFVKEASDATSAMVTATLPTANDADLAIALRELREALAEGQAIIPLLEPAQAPP